MKQSWKIPAICGILMVVFNVIVFALPIYKTPVVLISDIAVVIAIAAQIPISSIAMKKGTTVTSKVYGWPIISVGLRYLAAITACAMIFILISGVTLIFPIWLPIIVYVVLYGAAGIGLIAAESTRNYVEEQDIIKRRDDRGVACANVVDGDQIARHAQRSAEKRAEHNHLAASGL